MTEALSSKGYEVCDAFEAIELYYEKGWTDGLPVIPPTEERVRQFIAVTGRDGGEILFRIPMRRRAITLEKVAISAVMAGCLPEYMPVVVAAVEAMGETGYNLHGSATSTGGAATLLIVSGPAVKKLGINSGSNLFGPGVRANATIGRALRLFLINVCGANPGTMDRACMGHPGKYTYCIGEAENAHYEPHHVEKGLAATESSVTVMPMLGPQQVPDIISDSAETLLTTFAGCIAGMGDTSMRSLGATAGLRYCVAVFNEEHRGVLVRSGWSRQKVKDFLYQRSVRSVAELKRWGSYPGDIETGDETRMVAAVSAPDEIVVINAGGGGGFSACIAPWGGGFSSAPVTRAIQGM